MHPVKKLIGNRGSGKTYHLFEMAEKNDGVILTTDKRKEITQDYAKKLGFHVDVISKKDLEAICLNDILTGSIHKDINIYVDDLDEYIDEFLPPFCKVQAVTLTAGYELMIPTYLNKDTKK